MRASIVPVEADHVRYVSDNCRKADREEMNALGVKPLEAITSGLSLGGIALAGLIEETPCCVFGVAPIGGMLVGAGRPWLIGTDLIDRHALTFLRRNKGIIKTMLSHFDYLVNYVDTRNAKSIQWLKWLGFTIDQIEMVGPYSMPFHRFWMRG